jgi:hypothetical protein
MAEPARATEQNTLPITITYVNNQWIARPGTPEAGARVTNQGQVKFQNVPAGGCQICTSPSNAFVNEPSNGCQSLPAGDTTLTLTSAVADSVIQYCVCGPTDPPCSPSGVKLTGGYGVQSGNPPFPGGHRDK